MNIRIRHGKETVKVEISEELLASLVDIALGAKNDAKFKLTGFSNKKMNPDNVFLAIVNVDEEEYEGREFQFLELMSTGKLGVKVYRHIGSLSDDTYLSSGLTAVDLRTKKSLEIYKPTPIRELGAQNWVHATEDGLMANITAFTDSYAEKRGLPWAEQDGQTAEYSIKEGAIQKLLASQVEQRCKLLRSAYKIPDNK